MWPYTDRLEAIRDVLRLSRGMTYKSALAGLELGGGKAVIIGCPRRDKTPELLRAMGRFVDTLKGLNFRLEQFFVGGLLDIQQIRHLISS